MRHLMNHGELVVVETDDERWVGTVELQPGQVIVRSGRAGRPKILAADAVVRIAPAGDGPEI